MITFNPPAASALNSSLVIAKHPGLALALSVAAATRLLWLMAMPPRPVADAAYYHQHAADLAAGLGFRHPASGEPTAFLPPGYSMLLAGPYRLFGATPEVAAYGNIGLALVAVVAVYFLALRLYGPIVASAAALVIAAMPALVLYTNAVHADHLVLALAAVLAWLAVVPRGELTLRRAALCGLVVGLAVLTKPATLLLLPALAVSWRFSVPMKQSLRLTAVAAIAAFLVVSPWVIRNMVQLGTPAIATNGGVNLWIGHNPDAYGSWMGWRDEEWLYPINEVEKDAQYRNDAIRYAAMNPLDTVGRALWKLDHTFYQGFAYVEHFSLADIEDPIIGKLDINAARAWNEWLFRFLVVGALLSLPEIIRSRDRSIALLPLLVALLLPVVLFFGMDRFHVPLLPLLAVLSAGFIVRVITGQRLQRGLTRLL